MRLLKWKTVKSIAKIEVYREENGKVTNTEHYYILSSKMSMEMFEKATRSHWNI